MDCYGSNAKKGIFMTETNQLFDEHRHYQPVDLEILTLLGSREKQAQMRHHGRSPAFYRLGRKIIGTVRQT